ncbi:unnamed protein product [Brassica rapa]|uniref:Uncharacterized protein n=1 Tax=Brassica campestris TaxID=3711 RepID=A0A8D9D8B3_BRACM|nr:unnamed protein product [Brassica rapa]
MDVLCVLTDTHKHTHTATDVLCVLTDTHGRPVQPTWAQITQTVHGKGQRRAESKDQRADMCTDGQSRTSCVCTRTHTDSHGRPVCSGGHPRTSSHVGQNHPNSPREGPAC